MCGFVICFNDKKIQNKLNIYKKNKINFFNHRGPDNSKFYSDQSISILFNRLSIIDLSQKSNQPFISKNKRFVLVFNGEIYNYKDLSNEIKNKGFKFESDGEAEVLIKGFEIFGESFINKVRGMFAICLWDKKKNSLLTFRDRFGQKPLYYKKTEDGYIISSEIKDINILTEKIIDRETCKRYLYRNFLDNKRDTFFKDIKRILPAEQITFFKNKINKKIYWKPIISENLPFNKEEFLSKFLDNLNMHLNSDVNLAFLLSGGLDSSSLVSGAIELKKIKTFSIIPKHTFNERPYIDYIVKKKSISHQYIMLDDKLSGENFEEVLFYQDEPFQGINCLYQFYLNKKIREYGYKVVITGDGGDEILGGYERMFLIYLDYLLKNNRIDLFNKIIKIRKLSKFNILNKIKIFNQSLKNKKSDIEDLTAEQYLKNSEKISNQKILLENWNNLKLSKNQNLFKDTLINSIYTNDLQMSLRMSDRNSMSASIENRAPLLDHELVNYIFSIKTEDFYLSGLSKGLLRIGIKDISNNKIINRKKKSGRPGNDIYFLFFKVFDEFIDLLNISNLDDYGFNKYFLITDILKLKKILKKKIDNKDRAVRQNAFFYFRLYCFLKWQKVQKIV